MSGWIITGARLLGPSGSLLEEDALAVDQKGVIRALGETNLLKRRFSAFEEKRLSGLVTPGLVNAHTHLDLSWAKGKVPGGKGLYEWILQLRKLTPPGPDRVLALAVNALKAAQKKGVCFVVDHAGSELGLKALQEARMAGFSLVEILGRTPQRAKDRLDQVKALMAENPALGLTPHAPYSLHQKVWPQVLKSADEGPCLSLHYAESPHEARDWRGADATTEEFLNRLGVPWEAQNGEQQGPLSFISKKVTTPVLMVHGQHAESYEEALWQNALPVLCPRSSVHIGQPPRDPGGLGRFALGTDSLGSAPDLNVVSEAKYLLKNFPGTRPEALWQALTIWPAQHLQLKGLGALEPGYAPGLVHFQGDSGSTQMLSKAFSWKSTCLVSAGLFHG